MGTQQALPRLMRVKDAARYLAVSPATVRRLVQDGIVPAVKPGNNAPWLLDVKDLDRWIEAHKEYSPH